MSPRTPLLGDAAIDAALANLPGWERDGTALRKVYARAGFDGAIAFVNQLAREATRLDHHPDFAVSWNEVTVRTWSHDAGGITARDLDLAGALDALG